MGVDPGVVPHEQSESAAARERHRRHAEIVREIVTLRAGRLPRDAVVVGAGDGEEALALREVLCVPVVAVDRHAAFRAAVLPRVACIRADAEALPFRDGAFDFVYSYHALEHFPRQDEAIAEFRRVLGPGGIAFVGVPNKRRLFAYVCNRSVPLATAIAWNLKDYWAMIRGRFENELGAHAGFTEADLRARLGARF